MAVAVAIATAIAIAIATTVATAAVADMVMAMAMTTVILSKIGTRTKEFPKLPNAIRHECWRVEGS